MTQLNLIEEYRERAASLRRVAETMQSAEEREELLRIARGYEAQAELARATTLKRP
jgi:hypothetical protein